MELARAVRDAANKGSRFRFLYNVQVSCNRGESGVSSTSTVHRASTGGLAQPVPFIGGNNPPYMETTRKEAEPPDQGPWPRAEALLAQGLCSQSYALRARSRPQLWGTGFDSNTVRPGSFEQPPEACEILSSIFLIHFCHGSYPSLWFSGAICMIF